MSAFAEVTPRERAAYELRKAVRRVARDVYGAEIVEVPVAGVQDAEQAEARLAAGRRSNGSPGA